MTMPSACADNSQTDLHITPAICDCSFHASLKLITYSPKEHTSNSFLPVYEIYGEKILTNLALSSRFKLTYSFIDSVHLNSVIYPLFNNKTPTPLLSPIQNNLHVTNHSKEPTAYTLLSHATCCHTCLNIYNLKMYLFCTMTPKTVLYNNDRRLL